MVEISGQVQHQVADGIAVGIGICPEFVDGYGARGAVDARGEMSVIANEVVADRGLDRWFDFRHGLASAEELVFRSRG